MRGIFQGRIKSIWILLVFRPKRRRLYLFDIDFWFRIRLLRMSRRLLQNWIGRRSMGIFISGTRRD